MIQFSLDVWLQDKSRKVVTRDGREVEIVKYDIKGTRFPVLYVISNEDGTQGPCSCSKSGMCLFDNTQSSTDLFFADEEEKPQSIEISFGAEWVDQHPRKGLWDAEKVIEWLRNNSSKYMAEGINYPHYAYNSLVDDLTKAMEE